MGRDRTNTNKKGTLTYCGNYVRKVTEVFTELKTGFKTNNARQSLPQRN
jgi:hypothetical protein